MPEVDTVRTFLVDLLTHIREIDSPEGPTVLKGIFLPAKANADGDPFSYDPHDRAAIDSRGLLIRNVLDVEKLPESLKGRRIHSVHQIGTVLEILLLRDDFDPDAGAEQTVDVLRIIFKSEAQIGWIKTSEWGQYPTAYMPGTARTRVSAIMACDNLKDPGDGHLIALIDGLARNNWAQVLVTQRTVRPGDGGLGSEKWFLNAYGVGYDPYNAPFKWGPDIVDTLLGRRGKALTGAEFTGPLANAVNQGRCTLIQVLDSEYGFGGRGVRIKGDECGIHWYAQRNVCQERERRRGRHRSFVRRMVKYVNGSVFASSLYCIRRGALCMGVRPDIEPISRLGDSDSAVSKLDRLAYCVWVHSSVFGSSR